MVYDIVYLGDKAAIVLDREDLYGLYQLLGHQLTGAAVPVLRGGFGALKDDFTNGAFHATSGRLGIEVPPNGNGWQLKEK